MSNYTKNGNRVFEFFLILPAEMRMIVIDEMEPIDRCRFTRSSHLCGIEARKSKNYIYSLELIVDSEDSIFIEVGHKYVKEVLYRKPNGFELKTDSEMAQVGKKYMKYTIFYTEKLWRIELDSSTDCVQFFVEHFKSLLQVYQNIVKKVVISGKLFKTDRLKNYDFGIKHMNNLEELELWNGVGIGQFISKIRRPLKSISNHDNLVLADFEQISRVQENIFMLNLKLNNEQFLQLSAKEININIGELTEIDVINFIKSWQNGTIRDTFQYCMWRVDDPSSFDLLEIFRFFGFNPTGFEMERFIINHNKENDKKAKIVYFGRHDRDFVFEVVSNDGN